MVETVLAVLIVTAVFFGLFRLSRMLSGKILLEHAAMRVARARAVGFKDFMCMKAARVSVIPVAGRRLWPDEDGSLSSAEDLARVRTYLESPDGARPQGLLEYEGWHKLSVHPGDGGWSVVSMPVDGVALEGRAGIEDGASYYLEGGL